VLKECFSDRVTVLVRGKKGVTRMDELLVGDSVLTADGFAKVVSFGHYEPNTRSEFIQIYTENHEYAPLEITADHLLYAEIQQSGSINFVPAGTIQEGDFVLVENMTLAQVKRIRTIHRDGIYAPFTESGTIVVNGVVASNYIALPKSFQIHLTFEQQHSLQHSAHAPFRIYCQLISGCPTGRENAIGFPIGVSMWFPLLQWLERQDQAFLSRFFFVAQPLSNSYIRIEWIFQNAKHVITVILTYLMIKWKGKHFLFAIAPNNS
jgi:Hint module